MSGIGCSSGGREVEDMSGLESGVKGDRQMSSSSSARSWKCKVLDTSPARSKDPVETAKAFNGPFIAYKGGISDNSRISMEYLGEKGVRVREFQCMTGHNRSCASHTRRRG